MRPNGSQSQVNQQGNSHDDRHKPSDGNREAHRSRMQDHIKQRIEQGNPQHTALIGEFFRALRARREQRGEGTR